MASSESESTRLSLPWVYDTILWICTLAIDLFFREIQPRSTWRVPKKGPLIIVAGPHANQFVDSILLMQALKKANRRISFLIAEKSMREPIIGRLAALFGSLPVARAMDNVKPAMGQIYIDEQKDPLCIHGVNTDFTQDVFMVGGTIVFPRIGKTSPATAIIANIVSKTELKIKKPVKLHEDLKRSMVMTDGPPKGVEFKIAPHIDQTKVFDSASKNLLDGGCIGIFPEGGSHDRLELLPLKAGVSIMALNTLALDPDCGLSIVPCGLNYFHAHKFRSRAVIEFGPTIDVHPDQIEAYKAGGSERRNAVGSLLETINEGLTAVTQPSPDYETMLLVKITRRLYNPIGKKLPLSAVVELNRRFIKGYIRFHDYPKVIELKNAILRYDRQLRSLGIRDHQVEWGDTSGRPWWLTLYTLLHRVVEIIVLAIGTLPGLLLFWPVFVLSKIISIRKQKKALAASVVKVRGRDVVSTWKLLVSAVLAPALYIFYTGIATTSLYFDRTDASRRPSWAHVRTYTPDFLPLWLFSIIFLALMVSITFAALRLGETGMDIIKSLPPLVVALNPITNYALVRLRAQRSALAAQVREVINGLGPEIFEDFDKERIIADPYKEGAYQSNLRTMDNLEVDLVDDVVGVGGEGHERSLSGNGGSSFDLSAAFNFNDADDDDVEIDKEVDRRIRNAMLMRGRERSKSFRSGEEIDGGDGDDSNEDKKDR